jgi:aminopeptidase N
MVNESMLILRETRSQSLFLVLLLVFSIRALAVSPEPGVSRALAIARAARVSSLRYQLSFTLSEHASTVAGTETLTFASKSAGDLPIDYRDGILQSATLNGHPISTELVNGHLNLPAISGLNRLELRFTSDAAAAGKAITRYDDKDDGSEYFYTLFVPMDASMAFPCFDQPDLKARFTLSIEHPPSWTVIANTRQASADETHAHFAETLPISTYLFAFAAGPFAASRSVNLSEPTVFFRKSQRSRAEQEAPQVQKMAAQGIAYFSDYFAQPFPFPKYDLVLIPGFPFGGMEHAGETFLNEDAVLFRSTPTKNDYFRRNTLILHETCHQWFGDLVTMRWFDDLWLKEGFAQYMAYEALAQLDPTSDPWKHFYEDIKPLAYGIDETEGTTPIFQNIANLKDAKSAYGAIVYQKAPAVLKQLEFRIGRDTFRQALRSYLKQHAYSNAEWSDLIAAFKAVQTHPTAESRPPGDHAAPDLDAWADAWIKHRGMPEIAAFWSCRQGKIDQFELNQHDVLPDGFLWPISNQIALLYPGQSADSTHLLRADWDAATFNVTSAIGLPCPAIVFSNAGDQAYGRFLLDPVSETPVSHSLLETPLDQQDPLMRSMLWGALWENVRVAKSSPRSYVELALKALPVEDDESLARIQGSRLATAMHSYIPEAARRELAPGVESVVADRMLNAPTLGLRIVNFRTFTSISETPQALEQLKDLLSGKLAVPGLELKLLDRWNLVAHLLAMGDPEAQTIFAREKARDQGGEAKRYAYAAEAGTPSAEIKARYFDEYLSSKTIQEDWITQSLRAFNAWNQASLSALYLEKALGELPDIKQHRKIFFLGDWLAAFIDGQNTFDQSPHAQQVVRAWLSGKNIDPDLRLKVLEASDALDRTVRIRRAFPE